jgi:eukaryotic-like serine/threonine-protein kinase
MGGPAAPQGWPAGAGTSATRVWEPLRPDDPPWIGDYRLLALLGSGGMGRVFLGRSPAGQLVAVKLIRTDIAERDAFRRRFRSEVDRARQVPPFCTAEVLDADPDHDPPYLVVEYVDGPDLATVVRDRGPLSPANLHGLAIGVATALTAIHGAGVIHRDLKAANVLLAPGSPKVIDFGLAQEVNPIGAVGDTTTGEVVGTVAYMAPERIEPAGRELTPAVDIFAWGVVIAFAGTGTVPFSADSLPALAARILTEPPNLDGLPPDLRGLVGQALAKDPADRPTARQLLDRLLVTRGEAGSPPASRTELLRTGRRYAQVDPDDNAILTAAYPIAAATKATSARPTRTLLLWVTLFALLAVGAVAALVMWPSGTPAGPSGAATSAPPSSPAPGPIPAGAQLIVRDPLTAPGRWESTTYEAEPDTTCDFAGALVVTSQIPSFRCRGPADEMADQTVLVDVSLLEPGSCATIWFRFTVTGGGYALRVCEDAYYLVTHGIPESHIVNTLREFRHEEALATTTRVGIAAEGESLRFYRDGELVGSWSDATFDRGRVGLGVLQMRAEIRPPYRVSFANIEVWGSGG